MTIKNHGKMEEKVKKDKTEQKMKKLDTKKNLEKINIMEPVTTNFLPEGDVTNVNTIPVNLYPLMPNIKNGKEVEEIELYILPIFKQKENKRYVNLKSYINFLYSLKLEEITKPAVKFHINIVVNKNLGYDSGKDNFDLNREAGKIVCDNIAHFRGIMRTNKVVFPGILNKHLIALEKMHQYYCSLIDHLMDYNDENYINPLSYKGHLEGFLSMIFREHNLSYYIVSIDVKTKKINKKSFSEKRNTKVYFLNFEPSMLETLNEDFNLEEDNEENVADISGNEGINLLDENEKKDESIE